MKTRLCKFMAAWAWVWCAIAGIAPAWAANSNLQLGEPLKDWLVLKPIPVIAEKKGPIDDAVRQQAFARDWLVSTGGETGVEPRSGRKVKIAGHALRWDDLRMDTGSADLLVRGHTLDDALAYAWAEFEVPDGKEAVLGIGSDDAIKVWLNGKLVHEHWINRPVRLDEDLVPVELQAGKNRILLKVQNGVGPWGYACRVLSQKQAESLRRARAEMENPDIDDLTEAQIKTVLRDYIDTDKLGVGMVVGMVDEQGTRVISHGKASNGSNREVDGDTLFEIGSVTKVFTALLLQDMIERGEMSLDDPVSKYLPKTVRMPKYQGKEVTLLHLATHTSGLQREVDNLTPRRWRDPGAGYTVQQFYTFLSGCKLRHAPGMTEEYSNLGLQLLGHVIALKAGRNYETLVLDRICRPLGMDSTCVSLTPEHKTRLAIGHAVPGSAVCNEDFSILPADGSVKSTARDLLKFVSAYSGLTASPLRTVMENAQTEHILESGAKRRLVWFGNGPVFEHGGLTFGYKTELAFDTTKRRGIVVLSNCASSGLVSDVWRPLLERRSLVPTLTGTVPAGLYDGYQGLYETDKRARCAVRREDNRLMVQWLGTPEQRIHNSSFEVFPHSESVFCNKPLGHQLIQIIFVRHGEDSASQMILATPDFCLEARKVSSEAPKTPDPARGDGKLYDSYAGRYRMALLFGLIRIGPTFNIRHETDEVGEHLVAFVTGRGTHALIAQLGGGLAGGELFPESETTFFTPFSAVDVRATFVRNKKGKTTGMVVELGGKKIKGVRLGD